MRGFFFFSLLLCGVCLAAQVSHTDFVVKDHVLVKYKGVERDVIIPAALGVNRIGERAFAGTPVNSVVIPVGVGYVDERAFMGCSFLKNVRLPNTLISLGRRVFFNCFLLETINMPRSLVSIEEGAFYNCRGLKEIDIPNTLKSLGSRAFSGCLGIAKLSVSKRTVLGQNPFMGVPCAISYKD